MQKKFGTILDNKLLEQARAFCLKEHTPLNHLLEEAISEYLRKRKRPSSFSGAEASFGILKVPPKALKTILEEDFYETR